MGKAAYSDNVTVVPVLAVTTLTASSSFAPSSSFSAQYTASLQVRLIQRIDGEAMRGCDSRQACSTMAPLLVTTVSMKTLTVCVQTMHS